MYELNEKIILKKAHPCGGNEWIVVRVGADIKLRCAVCGKYVNLTREELKRRTKSSGNKEERDEKEFKG